MSLTMPTRMKLPDAIKSRAHNLTVLEWRHYSLGECKNIKVVCLYYKLVSFILRVIVQVINV